MADDFDKEWNLEAENGMNLAEFELYRELRKLGLDPVPDYKIKGNRFSLGFPEEELVIDILSPGETVNKKKLSLLKRLDYRLETFNAKHHFKAFSVFMLEFSLFFISHRSEGITFSFSISLILNHLSLP